MDVGDDTTAGDGRLDERVQLLVSPEHDGFFTGPDPQAQSFFSSRRISFARPNVRPHNSKKGE